MKIQSRLKGAAAPIALSVALLAQPVFAQDDTTPTGDEATTAATETADTAIIVTGSRIRGITAFNSPDPVTIVDPDIAMKEGKFDTASMLQSSPIAAGSTQITAALSSNFVTAGGPGAQTISLRGLGANRTLVLLNGRRAGPAGTRGSVSSFDLNVLPQSIIEDVQILKTGASSIYGSDAVAGVVNIITKKDTDGIQVSGNAGLPFAGGGEDYRLNAIWGKTFDRGHILIAADYSHTNELKRGDRSYLACPEANIYHADGTRADLIDPRTGTPHCEDLRWGHVWTYNLIDNLRLDGPGGPNTGINTSLSGGTVLMQYQYPGETLGIPAFGAPSSATDFGAPAGWFPTGYNAASTAVQNAYHPFVEEQTIIPKTDLYTAYAEGAYELTDTIELFGEFLYNRRETYQNGWRQFWNFGYTGDLYNTGNPTSTNLWGAGWSGVNLISPTAITNHADNSQQVDYFRGVGGLRGSFGKDSNWNWEAYAQYSKNIGRYRSEQMLQDAYDAGYFQTQSCVGTTLPTSGKQCMDIPWADPNFLAGNLTDAQADYLFDWEEGKTIYTQLTGEATISGDLLQLPAGALGLAAGITARQDKINDTPGDITLAGNAWGASTSGITAGKSVTTEAFAELNVPILADKPFFKDLTLSLAGRVTNVKSTRKSDGVSDSDNGNFTYKLGANWAVTDWLKFRGSYGTSFRAPALFEQFLADETSFPTQRIDPCRAWGAGLTAGTTSQRIADNCAADGIPSTYAGGSITATAISSGGLGVLDSETSRAISVGTVLTPDFDFLPDTKLSIAVDYFDIRVKGEITQLGAANILYGCYNSEHFDTEPLCDLFVRGVNSAAPYNVDLVYDKFVNIADQINRGVDVTINLRQDLGKMGMVNLTADMTWTTKDETTLLAVSAPESSNGEVGSPKWVGDFRMNWQTPIKAFSMFYGLSVIGGTSNMEDFLEDNAGDPCLNSVVYGEYCPDLTTPATFYHNASFSYDFKNFTLTAGINNIFNTAPPRVSVLNDGQISMLGPVVAASQYSFVGRRAFINLTAKY